MIVVADTTPLNYLILIGHPDVLHALYDKVIVPSAVLRELQHAKAPVQVSLWAQSPPFWLEERVVRQLDPTLPSTLGDGERQAISLGLQLRAELLLMDERIGRVHARARRNPQLVRCSCCCKQRSTACWSIAMHSAGFALLVSGFQPSWKQRC